MFEVTQKNPIDLSLQLTGRDDYPLLLRDEGGHKVILPKPRRTRAGAFLLHGCEFPESARGPLLQEFNASILHLGMHVCASDYTIYKKWAEKKDRYLAKFVKSIVEDAAADAYLKSYLPGIRSIIAYANAISHLRLREAGDAQLPSGLSLHQAVLSLQLIGVQKGEHTEEAEDAKKIADILTNLERSIVKQCKETDCKTDQKGRLEPRITEQERLKAASEIWEILKDNASPLEIPSRPYGEYWGGNSLFDLAIPLEENHSEVLKAAYGHLDLSFVEEEFAEEQTNFEAEAVRVLETESTIERKMERALKEYNKMGAELKFRNYGIPPEDYTQYIKARGLLAGSIRRILDETRKVKQCPEESPLEESGGLDLQAAIQVLASQSVRNDIFVKEEIQQKSEAWAILIDASISLRMFELDVRSIAVCLAEVAKDLITSPNSWGLFAFNDTFQVVKDFYETYSNRGRAKIGGLRHSGLSYIPDAIDLAAKALSKTSEDVKVLLIVTDAVPLGYAGIEERFKDSYAKVRASSIVPIIIGLGNSSIKRTLRPSCSIESAYELMRQFVKTYLEVRSYT